MRSLFVATFFLLLSAACGADAVVFEDELCHTRITTYWTQVSCDSPCGTCAQQCWRETCRGRDVDGGCYEDTVSPDCLPLAD